MAVARFRLSSLQVSFASSVKSYVRGSVYLLAMIALSACLDEHVHDTPDHLAQDQIGDEYWASGPST